MDEKKNLSPIDRRATDGLQAALEVYRSSKSPKGVTEGRKREWAELIGAAFQDASQSFEVLRAHLELLPPSITASGIARVWPALSKDRRSEYLRWLAGLDAERAAGQKAILIPALLATSPESAVQLLSDLRLSKDLRDRLATLIFDSKDHVGIFFGSEVPRYKFPELLSQLLVLFESPKASLEAKTQLIRSALEQIVSRNLQNGSEGIGILRLLEPRLSSLPTTAKKELQSFLANLDQALCERLFQATTN